MEQAASSPEWAQRVQRKLRSLAWLPHGEIDDTRFEKLLLNLAPFCKLPYLHHLLELDALSFFKAGAAHPDPRLRSVALRLFGELSSVFDVPTGGSVEVESVLGAWGPRIEEEWAGVLTVSAQRLDQVEPPEPFSGDENAQFVDDQEEAAEDGDGDFALPSAPQKPKTAEQGPKEEEEQKHSVLYETALTKSAVLVALQQWIPKMPEWNCPALIGHFFAFIRAGLGELSHFVQADAIGALVALVIASQNSTDLSLRSGVVELVSWIASSHTFSSQHQMTVLLLLDALVFEARAEEVLRGSGLATRAVSFLDPSGSVIVRQRARESIAKLLSNHSARPMAMSLLFGGDFDTTSPSNLFIEPLIQQTLASKEKESALEAIRLLSCVSPHVATDAAWLADHLRSLCRILQGTHLEGVNSTLAPWTADLRRGAVNVFALLASLLLSSAQKCTQISTDAGVEGECFGFVLQSAQAYLTHSPLAFKSGPLTIGDAAVMGKVILRTVELIGAYNRATAALRSLVAGAAVGPVSQYLLTCVTTVSTSTPTRRAALECLFTLLVEEVDYEAHLLTEGRLGQVLRPLFASPSWELRDTAVSLAHRLSLSKAKQISKFVLEEALLEQILLAFADSEPFVRTSALSAAKAILCEQVPLVGVLMTSPSWPASLARCLALAQDTDPLSRQAKVALIGTMHCDVGHLPILDGISRASGTTLRDFVGQAANDDDWEVRLEACHLLSAALDVNRFHTLNGATVINSLAQTDSNRAVRACAWAVASALLAVEFAQALRFDSEGTSISAEDISAIQTLKKEDLAARRREFSVGEFYDEDDDIYPLRAEHNNEIDCPL